MFVVIRLIIACVVVISLLLFIKNIKIKYGFLKGIVTLSFVSVLLILSLFIPPENVFVTFSSSADVYGYVNFGSSYVKMILEGDNCDLVVGDKGDTDVFLIVPKTETGYKIDNGINTKKVNSKIVDDVVVSLYKYDKSDDYFITISNTDGEENEVFDNCNSKFFSLSRNNDVLHEKYITYYAHIKQYSKDYCVNVNGENIVL